VLGIWTTTYRRAYTGRDAERKNLVPEGLIEKFLMGDDDIGRRC